MAAKKKPASLGDKVKKVLKDTAKQTGKDLLTLGTIVGPGKAVKVGKTVKALSAAKKAAPKASARQAGDYAVPGKSAKQTMPKAGKANAEYRYGKNSQISKNVSIKDTTSPSGKQFIRGGAAQVMNQNARLTAKVTKAEAKANARGLKAANKPLKSKSAEIARAKAAIRAENTMVFNRTPAQNLAMSRTNNGSIAKRSSASKSNISQKAKNAAISASSVRTLIKSRKKK